MASRLTVLLGGRPAASIDSDAGRLTLAYDGDYAASPDAVPLSLSLPIADRPYGHDAVERWLVGLLPDNPRVLDRWYERENAPSRTPFGLLSCQALGAHPHRNFQWGGGPGAAAAGDLIRRHSTDPDKDIRRFRDALLFAWATVNRDAHIRNYSVLIQSASVRLAPLYDLGSSLPFARGPIGELKLAMALGGDCTIYRSDAADALPTLAALLRLPADETINAAERIAAQTPDAIRGAAKKLPSGTPLEAVERLAARATKRSANCLKAVDANRSRIAATRQPAAAAGTAQEQRSSAGQPGSADNAVVSGQHGARAAPASFEASPIIPGRGQKAPACGRPTPTGPCRNPKPPPGGRCAAGHER